jgi:hypothetical protein
LDDVAPLRDRLNGRPPADSVQSSAQAFVIDLAGAFPGIVLARVFLVLPFAALPDVERQFAQKLVGEGTPLEPTTNVLSLAGTYGRDAAWRDRRSSAGHLAIPLVDRSFVANVPMLAKLLADLNVDFAALDDGKPIATRKMLGGHNAAFYVGDATKDVDDRGRFIIPSRAFVDAHGVRTVFGMGGAYVDGTLAIIIAFTDELIPRLVTDRFSSLISSFKMVTSENLAQGRIF